MKAPRLAAFVPSVTSTGLTSTADGWRKQTTKWLIRRLLALGAAFFLGPSIALAQPSSSPRDDFWVPDGPVNAVLETNGVIYVGGLFNYVSPNTGTGGAFDLLSGASLLGFPKFSGAIKIVIPDNQGGWFVGGAFSSVDGFPISNLARIRADKTLDPHWLPNPDGEILTLLSSSNMLYAGGSFSTIGGVSRRALAALNPDTGETLPWQADATHDFFTPVVTSLALADGELFIGGFFSLINEVEREHLASVDAATGQVTSWFPNAASGEAAFVRIAAIAIADRVLFVGGTFNSLGGTGDRLARNFLAALDTSTNRTLAGSVLPWNPDANGPVSSITISCDTVYVGGSFTTIGGTNRNYIAALDIVTGKAKDWSPEANGDVLKVVLAGNVIYAGGRFTAIGGQPRSFLGALDVDSGQATRWNPRADSGVAGLAVSGGAVVAGGTFSPGGKARKNAAAFDTRTGRLLDWSPVIDGSTPINTVPYQGVEVMGARSNTVYLGGPFSMVNREPRNRLAAVDAVTGTNKPWNPNPDGIVKSLAVSEGAIYVGGLFATNGGLPRANLAALDPVTGAATSWNPGANDKVTALTLLGNSVYAGGLFTSIGGMSRRRLAALDAESGEVLAWGGDANNQVSALAALDGTLYLGGHFSKLGPLSINRVAALDTQSGSPTCWLPDARAFEDGSERHAAVNAIITSGDVVYVGGTFSTIGGQPRRHLAALDASCPGSAVDWNPDLGASVRALAQFGNSVAAGGVFQNVGAAYRPNLAVFPPVGSPSIVVQPNSHFTNAGQSVLLQAVATGQGTLSYQWQLNGTNLPGANEPNLIIANAQVHNAGDYTLVVTNQLGLINSRPATLTVIEPLMILLQPASQTVGPGANVTLSVVAIGSPPPIYQWRLNGVTIPGAIDATFSISNAQPTDGGDYSVVVANVGGAINSEIATLLVTNLSLPFRDNLANRQTITGGLGSGSGSNIGATNEVGETNHVGKVGGSSVWLGWRAPAGGIATFNTRGSSFDTLLAIYTNAPQGGLVPLAADEDSGGFLTSQASFNAIAGIEYLLAVDGFAGASGNIVLSWRLDTNAVPFPRFLNQPVSLTVAPGQSATFSVNVDSPTPVTYQWFHECRAIAGANSSNLTVIAVQPADVGRYHVEVSNASTLAARSFDASLDIGPDLKVISQDKLEDLLALDRPGVTGGLFKAASGSSPPLSAYVSVTAGSIDSHTLSNSGDGSQPLETNHCAVLGGASKWIGIEALASGVIIVDTLGSAIDTVMAVYRPTNIAYLSSTFVICDNDGASDGIRSQVRFSVARSEKFLVAVDGVNRAQGEIKINSKLGVPPPSGPPTKFLPLLPGTNLTLVASAANAIPPPTYRWYWNGMPITGATQANLSLLNVQSGQAGTYSVVLSNIFGVSIQTNAVLFVPGPLRLLSHGMDSLGRYALSVEGGMTPSFVLQATTNDPTGSNWTSLLTNPITQQPFRFLDTNGSRHRQRFYRAQQGP